MTAAFCYPVNTIMNILELDSYNLADAVKFNDQLNPRIWDGNKMRPEVREKLLAIAEDFKEFLGLDDINVKDITVSGSNANYSYTPYSDIDLHLVVDIPKADEDEVYRELFDAKKYQYNDLHNIKIGGYDVELYVENANKPPVSKGVYSVLHNDWINIPKKIRSTVDDDAVRSKYEDLKHRIDSAVKSKDTNTITKLAEKIKAYRQAGLDQHGELGPENLAYKMLRTQGKIAELYDARNAAKDRELSLKEKAVTEPKKITWGFKTPRVLETEEISTAPEQPKLSDEDILKDFIKFCVAELKIESMPTIKLRKDPQWSVVHRTFGRYINDQHLLEVAWGQRHIMDVLRTVAHELTHKHQHERDGHRMGPEAGETGSKWENEANARAGILMRDYARLHPDYFAVGQAQGLKEANPAQQLAIYNPDGTTYRQEKMPVMDPDDFHSDTNPKKRIDKLTHQDLANRTATDLVDPIEKTNQNIDRERLKSAIRTSMGSLSSNETAVLNMRFWKDMTLAQTARALKSSPERVRQIEAKALRKLRHPSRSDRLEPFVNEATGYIPTLAQANDPRFKMALTKDIRPGALGRAANAFLLNTDSQGHPQELRPDGLVDRMMAEFTQFKKKNKLAERIELDEVRMSPSNLMQWATSDEAKGVRAGFEAELIFRDTQRNGDDNYDMEPDRDMDERCRTPDQVVEFFENDEWGYGLNSRQAERLREQLDEMYYEWYDDQMYSAWQDERDELIKEAWLEDKPWTERIHAALVDGLDMTDEEADAIEKLHELRERGKIKGSDMSEEQLDMVLQYSEAKSLAEDILNDDVEQTIAKEDGFYDEVLDSFRDGFYIDDDRGFFDAVGLRWMSDVANEFDLSWPYMTGGNSGTGNRSWDEVGDSLNGAVDMTVKVSDNYHGVLRREGQWIVEPDSSLEPNDSDDMGLEIVSPPMPLLTALEKLQKVTDWANGPGDAYTNSSTGLHMGVSVPYKGGDVDYVKLILGDEYVLKSFGREANTYCKSAMLKFRENIKGGRADPMGVIKYMQSGLLELAHRDLQKSVGEAKYTSAHIQNGYIEFRSAGGDWLAEENAEPGKLQNTMLRYARAMSLAANPSAERREYAKKLYKLVAPEGDSELALFSQYAAGELTAEQLKKRWAEKKMNQRWKLFYKDGTPVPGAEWNGYTEDQVKNAVWSKYGREALDSGKYQLVNMSEEQQWEVYDVNTGKTLEIVKGRNKGEVSDRVFDKYAAQGTAFNVRPYQDPATMTPRAKLAKRIVEPKAPQAQAPTQATNERGVPYWEVYEKETGHVVHTFLSDDLPDAVTDAYNWLTSIGAEQPDLFKVRPKMNTVNENFADGKGPGRPGDSVRHGIPKHATMAELEKASHAGGRKGQLARWQLNMRRGKKK